MPTSSVNSGASSPPILRPAVIRLENVAKTYAGASGPVEALTDISLSVAQGEIYGIIGRSGAGKSTLIRCVNLLERPTGGRVIVDGDDVTALPERDLRAKRRQIGMIFQHFNLLSSRSVIENVAFPLELAGLSRAEAHRKALPLLDLVGLAEKRDVYPRALSGGQKQRVGIARALASEPKVLLSDEATSALDPQTTETILELLRDINRQLGLTVLLITHEMSVIRDIAHKVAVMEGGRIVEQGPTADVFARPQAETTRDFVKGLFNRDLPAAVARKLKPVAAPGDQALIRIQFHGERALKPVISQLVRRFDIDVNLLHGQLDHIGDAAFGTLVIALANEGDIKERVLADLAAQSLDTEVLGYVSRAA
jgi:D-methionine transport system ATP-binding protein